MKAITVADMEAGVNGMTLTDIDYPHAAENDVIVRVHAEGFMPGELTITVPGNRPAERGHERPFHA
jgi:NADPH:quinone reductase-like Zn-dependent oxidoreductase